MTIDVLGKNLKIKFLSCGGLGADPNWHFVDHKHGYFEFICVLRGKARIKYGGKMHDVKAPCVLVYEPGKLHEEWSDRSDPWQTIFAGLEIRARGLDFSGLLRREEKGLIIIDAPREARACIQAMKEVLAESVRQDFGWQHVVHGLLFRFFRHAIKKSEIARGKKRDISGAQAERRKMITEKLKKYIDEHVTEKLTLNMLTETVYLSPFYLSHIFKEETGYSPIQYVINRKMAEAKKLLADPSLTVSQVAEKIGYDSIHYFSRLFTGVENITPSAYRERLFRK
jgi:AraC-like DNA-binding protein